MGYRWLNFEGERDSGVVKGVVCGPFASTLYAFDDIRGEVYTTAAGRIVATLSVYRQEGQDVKPVQLEWPEQRTFPASQEEGIDRVERLLDALGVVELWLYWIPRQDGSFHTADHRIRGRFRFRGEIRRSPENKDKFEFTVRFLGVKDRGGTFRSLEYGSFEQARSAANRYIMKTMEWLEDEFGEGE